MRGANYQMEVITFYASGEIVVPYPHLIIATYGKVGSVSTPVSQPFNPLDCTALEEIFQTNTRVAAVDFESPSIRINPSLFVPPGKRTIRLESMVTYGYAVLLKLLESE